MFNKKLRRRTEDLNERLANLDKEFRKYKEENEARWFKHEHPKGEFSITRTSWLDNYCGDVFYKYAYYGNIKSIKVHPLQTCLRIDVFGDYFVIERTFTDNKFAFYHLDRGTGKMVEIAPLLPSGKLDISYIREF